MAFSHSHPSICTKKSVYYAMWHNRTSIGTGKKIKNNFILFFVRLNVKIIVWDGSYTNNFIFIYISLF
jgi:hypothetical protein